MLRGQEMTLAQSFPGCLERPLEHVTKLFAKQSQPRLLQKAILILYACISALNIDIITNTLSSSNPIPDAKS